MIFFPRNNKICCTIIRQVRVGNIERRHRELVDLLPKIKVFVLLFYLIFNKSTQISTYTRKDRYKGDVSKILKTDMDTSYMGMPNARLLYARL